jgi:hypothetical protein
MATTRKKKPRTTNTNAKRLGRVLAKLDAPGDVEVFCDDLFKALHARLLEVDEAEECVVFYVGSEGFEREACEAGILQAFLRFSPESDIVAWACGAYRMFKRPKAAAVMKKAIALAKKQAPRLEALGKLRGKAASAAWFAYRGEGLFDAVEAEAQKHLTMSAKERLAVVRKHRKHFEELAEVV